MNVIKNNNSIKQYELVNFCEFDKYAIKSYCAIHGVDESLNLGDITKVDETKLKPFNMICGGSPCQDFSVVGKQVGSRWMCKKCGYEYNPLTVHFDERDKCPKCDCSELDKSRSSLLVEWLRVVKANKPKWGIYENVKNIVGKQFKETFELFLSELQEYGYNTYYQVLNARGYGAPQNRERVYLVIIQKDLDNGLFRFPEPFDSNVTLGDVLEDEVEEKYYVNTQRAQEMINDLVNSGKLDKATSNSVRTGGARFNRQTSVGFGKGEKIKPCIISGQGRVFNREAEAAATLLARDYKGFGNQETNGVLVKNK